MWFRKPVIYVADTVNPVRIPLNSVLLNKNESLSGNGLCQSKVEYGGDTVHNFDQNLNFTSAKFYFYLPEEYLSNPEALLGEAELIIDQALFKGYNFATPNMAFDVRLDLDSAV